MAEGLGSILMIALLVFAGVFIWRMLRGSRNAAPANPRMEPAYAGGDAGSASSPNPPNSAYTPMSGSAMPGSVASLSSSGAGPVAAAPWGVPDDFDSAAFLRNAKVYFIRLQAAWDSKNLVDIREFGRPKCSPSDADGGGQRENQTDVATPTRPCSESRPPQPTIWPRTLHRCDPRKRQQHGGAIRRGLESRNQRGQTADCWRASAVH
jgi:predicted lipid-binding transport protein (Tim44 family)